MIPKIIHYCWFGENVLPKLERQCISSWKKNLPDYEFKVWSEKNFDINTNTYVKQAYEAGKYAFVADYVRLYALYTFGGIYLDTDVQVLKSFNPLLTNSCFMGLEEDNLIGTCVIGSEKGGDFIGEILEKYNNRVFINEIGNQDTMTNVQFITDILRQKGFHITGMTQEYEKKIKIFPKDYFSPKSYRTNKLVLTKETYAIHHFSGSWLPWYHKLKPIIYRLFGKRFVLTLKRVFNS